MMTGGLLLHRAMYYPCSGVSMHEVDLAAGLDRKYTFSYSSPEPEQHVASNRPSTGDRAEEGS